MPGFEKAYLMDSGCTLGIRETRRLVGKYVLSAGEVINCKTFDDAIARVKRCACPPNCRRLGKRTPCAATGVCADCDSPDRICKVTAIFDRRHTGMPTKVIVVDADLGY